MVPADESLQTRPYRGRAKVLAKLDRLVHEPIAIAQVGGLRVAEVDAEALDRAVRVGQR